MPGRKAILTVKTRYHETIPVQQRSDGGNLCRNRRNAVLQRERQRTNPPPEPVKLDAPSAVVTERTPESLTVEWKAVDNAASYEYGCRAEEAPDFSAPVSTSRSGFKIEGLEAETAYIIRIRALPEKDSEKYLPSDYGETRAVTSETMPQVLQTPALTVTEITHESITAAWEAIPNAASYRWDYKPTESENFSEPAETVNPEITIGGLIPETHYIIRVTALPGENSGRWLESEPGRAEGTTLPVPAVDLNASGAHANCYIASRPGETYRFDAKVQGNGAAAPGITPRSIEPKDVFTVWESSDRPGGVIASCSLSGDGLVTFTTSETGGNALIAVTDGNPAEGLSRGRILWSWHIWSTDYPDGSDVTFENHDGDTYTLMSRNLGALNETPATEDVRGLYYQWGRKDSFLGFVAGGGTPYGCTSEEDYIWEMQPAQAQYSIESAIAYPTVFFAGGYASGNDWYYGGGPGADNRNNYLWGNVTGEASAAVKTIYDPCPQGYRVAPLEAFTGFTATGATTVKQSEMNVTGEYDEGWHVNGTEGRAAFFPSAGYLVFSSGIIYSSGGYNGAGFYATSTPAAESAKLVRIEKSMLMYASSQRASGSSVRCMKERAN